MAFDTALRNYLKAQEESRRTIVSEIGVSSDAGKIDSSGEADASPDSLNVQKANANANTLGQIMSDHLAWILNNPGFSKQQKKAAGMIAACKTESLGYYAEYCPNCDKVLGIHYRSCKNRYCSNCQKPSQLKWTMLREAEVIPGIPYFHVVLTLPHALNPLIQANPRLILNMFMRTSASAVVRLSQDPRFLGATPGIVSVLHTWNQELGQHYHVHMIVSGGGLDRNGVFVPLKPHWEKRIAEYSESVANADRNSSGKAVADTDADNAAYTADAAAVISLLESEDDAVVSEIESLAASSRSVPGSDTSEATNGSRRTSVPFFLPQRALTKLFRGKFLSALSSMYHEKKLSLTGELEYYQDPARWNEFTYSLSQKSWVGHIVRTFEGNGNAIEYLARYTFSTAIYNSRILEYTREHVTISCRNNQDFKNKRMVTLDSLTFISRFLSHVLPSGFARMRYYGFLSNAQKKRNIQSILDQIHEGDYRPEEIKDSVDQLVLERLGLGEDCVCPCCRGKLEIIGVGIYPRYEYSLKGKMEGKKEDRNRLERGRAAPAA